MTRERDNGRPRMRCIAEENLILQRIALADFRDINTPLTAGSLIVWSPTSDADYHSFDSRLVEGCTVVLDNERTRKSNLVFAVEILDAESKLNCDVTKLWQASLDDHIYEREAATAYVMFQSGNGCGLPEITTGSFRAIYDFDVADEIRPLICDYLSNYPEDRLTCVQTFHTHPPRRSHNFPSFQDFLTQIELHHQLRDEYPGNRVEVEGFIVSRNIHDGRFELYKYSLNPSWFDWYDSLPFIGENKCG